jgi:hypothetical protein
MLEVYEISKLLVIERAQNNIQMTRRESSQKRGRKKREGREGEGKGEGKKRRKGGQEEKKEGKKRRKGGKEE